MDTHDLHSSRWLPPHCPSHKCKYHNPSIPHWRFKRMGCYLRLTHPQRIRRFRCLHCGVTFSSQTFATSYWLKKPQILPKLMTKITGGMCNSQIATDLRVSPATIDRQIYRLGRHCLLFHQERMKAKPKFEALVLDSLVTFEYSQYHPYHLHLTIDPKSTFIPWFTDSEVRRSGRMTPRQKQKRAELEQAYGRPDTRAVPKDVTELLTVVCAEVVRMTLYSDEHRDYVLAVSKVPCEILHVVTSSKAHRGRCNDLYEVNLLDLLIRHAQADHKRETIAYAKRRNCGVWRLAIFLVWKNYVRLRRVRGCKETPAMVAGVCQRRLTVRAVLGRRLFIEQLGLEGRWRQYYWGEVRTRALKVNRRHELQYAA